MKALGIGLLVALLVWVIGFAWFVQIAGRAGQVPPHSDGIVAFTGGADRVETALRLLAEQRGDKLLLSGIGGGAELAELAPRAGVDPLPLASRVTLGRSATTTRGNAQETAAWAQSERDPLAARGDRRLPHASRSGRTRVARYRTWRCTRFLSCRRNARDIPPCRCG